MIVKFTDSPFDTNYPFCHYDGVIMGVMASQITSLTIVYSTVYADADQGRHQSSDRGPVNSTHKWPVTRKMFPFHDVIMAKKLIISPRAKYLQPTSKIARRCRFDIDFIANTMSRSLCLSTCIRCRSNILLIHGPQIRCWFDIRQMSILRHWVKHIEVISKRHRQMLL